MVDVENFCVSCVRYFCIIFAFWLLLFINFNLSFNPCPKQKMVNRQVESIGCDIHLSVCLYVQWQKFKHYKRELSGWRLYSQITKLRIIFVGGGRMRKILECEGGRMGLKSWIGMQWRHLFKYHFPSTTKLRKAFYRVAGWQFPFFREREDDFSFLFLFIIGSILWLHFFPEGLFLYN